ncbi:MAG TPA: CGNR zinc finger domain-containing protein [Trebonia sp.]
MRIESPLGEREQQDALLELLNTTPLVTGAVEDQLADLGSSRSWQQAHGGSGTAKERDSLVEARDALQAVVRGQESATSLAPLLDGVAARPRISPEGIAWVVEAPPERRLALQMITAFSALQENMAGRLRACANPDCRRFLIDRSNANKARWCSMAVCGNRMKARLHYQRVRGDGE